MNPIEQFLLDELIGLVKSKITPVFIHGLEQSLINKLWAMAQAQNSTLEEKVVEVLAEALGCEIPLPAKLKD